MSAQPSSPFQPATHLVDRLPWVDPELPEWMGRLRIANIPLAGQRITIDVDRAGTKIEGLPPGIEVVGHPRDPLTA